MRTRFPILFFVHGRKLPRLQKDACNEVDNGGDFIRRRIHTVNAFSPEVSNHCTVGKVGNEPTQCGRNHRQAKKQKMLHQLAVNIPKGEHLPQLCAANDKDCCEKVAYNNRKNISFDAHSQYEKEEHVASNGQGGVEDSLPRKQSGAVDGA